MERPQTWPRVTGGKKRGKTRKVCAREPKASVQRSTSFFELTSRRHRAPRRVIGATSRSSVHFLDQERVLWCGTIAVDLRPIDEGAINVHVGERNGCKVRFTSAAREIEIEVWLEGAGILTDALRPRIADHLLVRTASVVSAEVDDDRGLPLVGAAIKVRQVRTWQVTQQVLVDGLRAGSSVWGRLRKVEGNGVLADFGWVGRLHLHSGNIHA